MTDFEAELRAVRQRTAQESETLARNLEAIENFFKGAEINRDFLRRNPPLR